MSSCLQYLSSVLPWVSLPALKLIQHDKKYQVTKQHGCPSRRRILGLTASLAVELFLLLLLQEWRGTSKATRARTNTENRRPPIQCQYAIRRCNGATALRQETASQELNGCRTSTVCPLVLTARTISQVGSVLQAPFAPQVAPSGPKWPFGLTWPPAQTLICFRVLKSPRTKSRPPRPLNQVGRSAWPLVFGRWHVLCMSWPWWPWWQVLGKDRPESVHLSFVLRKPLTVRQMHAMHAMRAMHANAGDSNALLQAIPGPGGEQEPVVAILSAPVLGIMHICKPCLLLFAKWTTHL